MGMHTTASIHSRLRADAPAFVPVAHRISDESAASAGAALLDDVPPEVSSGVATHWDLDFCRARSSGLFSGHLDHLLQAGISNGGAAMRPCVQGTFGQPFIGAAFVRPLSSTPRGRLVEGHFAVPQEIFHR